MPIRKLLVANRGEIALRIVRACKALSIASVAVYSEADRDAPFAQAADEGVLIGPPPPLESYLDGTRIVAAARATGADAVHPGYGFLSENADFAAQVAAAGLVWVGPPADVIRALGDKTSARRRMAAAGVPIVPGSDGPDLEAAARALGFPVLVKAAAGGGGKGMRVVHEPADLGRSLEACGREALAAFGDGRLFLERFVEKGRHVEIQVIADQHGQAVHLHERDCSLQRRHQKVVEESPSPALDRPLRERMAAAALAAARTAGYVNAGTVEFMLAPSGEFYFLEVNARLQVEHPVTEAVCGIDLVAWQLAVAAGERLPARQEDIAPRGHAIEVRVYAEDPARGFLPSPGTILALEEPGGPGIRVDSGVREGLAVPPHYDPLLAKLIAWGPDRPAARRRLVAALDEYRILGVVTNLSFLRALVASEAFASGNVHTGSIEAGLALDHQPPAEVVEIALAAAAAAAILSGPAAHVRPEGSGLASIPTPWDTLGPLRLGEGPAGGAR